MRKPQLSDGFLTSAYEANLKKPFINLSLISYTGYSNLFMNASKIQSITMIRS